MHSSVLCILETYGIWHLDVASLRVSGGYRTRAEHDQVVPATPALKRLLSINRGGLITCPGAHGLVTKNDDPRRIIQRGSWEETRERKMRTQGNLHTNTTCFERQTQYVTHISEFKYIFKGIVITKDSNAHRAIFSSFPHSPGSFRTLKSSLLCRHQRRCD
jgi:hypothetical protein